MLTLPPLAGPRYYLTLSRVTFLCLQYIVKFEFVYHRLIGVVGLKELRKAIEDANSGQVNRTHMHQIRFLQVLNFYTWNSFAGYFYNLIPCFPPHIYFLAFSFQAAETPKPRDVESPKDSGVRKRKGGQANVNGQVNAKSS